MHHRWNYVASLVVLGAAIFLGGCGTSSRSSAPPESVGLYQSRQFEAAYSSGQNEMNSGRDFAARQRGQLMAGLSAYELKRYPEAKSLLGSLTTSEDAKLAGQAAAGLGLAYIATDDYARAAEYLVDASRKLEGDEAARAAMFAGDCHALLGRIESAKSMYRAAQSSVSDSSLAAQIQKRLSLDGFTVQVGAYSQKTNADRIMAGLKPRAKSLGLPEPKLVLEPDATGRTLYLVQLGRFKSLMEAQAAKNKLGREGVIRQVGK
ncbi:MAG TPA: SPOR domain-containing protein [Phycisphaerales bacterium]|nr:SPOR domain-containing protein [Phycisphaerales bacterium]